MLFYIFCVTSQTTQNGGELNDNRTKSVHQMQRFVKAKLILRYQKRFQSKWVVLVRPYTSFMHRVYLVQSNIWSIKLTNFQVSKALNKLNFCFSKESSTHFHDQINWSLTDNAKNQRLSFVNKCWKWNKATATQHKPKCVLKRTELNRAKTKPNRIHWIDTFPRFARWQTVPAIFVIHSFRFVHNRSFFSP